MTGFEPRIAGVRSDHSVKGAKTSVTRKKSQNVYKSCPKMISLEK